MQANPLRRPLLATAILAALCTSLAACQSMDRPAEETAAAATPGDNADGGAARDAVGERAAVDAVIAPPRPSRTDRPRSMDAKAAGHVSAEHERRRGNAVAALQAPMPAMAPPPPPASWFGQPANTEHYAAHPDNPVHRAAETPLSTFSIDVDTGSYANVRRMLEQGIRPPADAVRAEEMLNYFDYRHPAPASREVPFRVSTELAPAPWNAGRQLLMIGIQGYDLPGAELPPANLVFLIDTSGSMESPDKLPLLKQAFGQLVRQLRPQDRVSIVVYAGSAGLVLPPTPGDRRGEILGALERLQAGGSTNGGDGIRLAYATARRAFVEGGANRVILATDGDFNVGTVDQGALETLVADQRRSGIALSTLGFGSGNYNDALAERLADVGDGNHAYIDSVQEARKVLVRQMGATLLTIAKDVKIQVEFNPARVAEYRLVGYENRVLRDEDFANDAVDAGDIGAGHSVTALYEITPVGSPALRLPALRYGRHGSPGADAAPARGDELADLRLRYKRPGEAASQLIETPVLARSLRPRPSDDLRFAAAVAGYADALRGGTHLDGWSWDAIAATAQGALGDAPSAERREFVQLVDRARALVAGDRPDVAKIAD